MTVYVLPSLLGLQVAELNDLCLDRLALTKVGGC